MIQKVVNALLNWLLTSVIVPISWVFINYFRMKKTIKELNEEINRLKNAKTKADIDNSIDNLP